MAIAFTRSSDTYSIVPSVLAMAAALSFRGRHKEKETRDARVYRYTISSPYAMRRSEGTGLFVDYCCEAPRRE